MLPSKVIVTTTTLYPDPEGKDRVRFGLACELCQEAQKHGHLMVIADGSSDDVKDAFSKRGTHVVPQEKGMGQSRRQVFREASKLVTPDVAGIFWTEEKPSLMAQLKGMVVHMRLCDAEVLIPSRKPECWVSYPSFQVKSEAVCLDAYNLLFARGEEKFDPMFGPVLFSPTALRDFSEFDAEGYGLSGYIQHHVPIFLRHSNRRVVSFAVDWEQPLEQRQQEEGELLKKMMEHRLIQAHKFVIDYIKMYKLVGPLKD